MKIEVHYNDCTVGNYGTLWKAEEAILNAHANGVGVDLVMD